MNKRIINISLFLMLASTGNVLAQQGIGTNTPYRSAALQIDSQNKGILIPRINLGYEASSNKITSTIPSPVQGLLVYNQTGIDNVPEGFYYFDGTYWNPISKSYLQAGNNTTITGSGTTLDPYIISAVTGLENDITSFSNLQEDGKIIGTYENEENSSFNIKETVTSLSYQNNQLIYTNEVGVQAGIPIVGEDTKTQLTNGNYTTVSLHPIGSSFQNNTTNTYKVDVNLATKPLTGEATYGVVKPGAGLSIAENGTLKVDFPVESITVSNISTNNTLTTTVNNVTGNAVSLVKTNTLSLETGNNSKQLTSTVNGISATLDLSSIDTNTTYTANNGVKIENNVVKLGGDLSEPTTIKNVGLNVLKLEGLSNTKQVESVVNTSNNTLTSSTINKVLVVDANHTVKTVNAVMPEFFYMPSIVINTAATTVDLYQQYLNQFGNPMISNTNNEGKLPVLNRNMLDYHVTYYDNNVLTNVSINDNGVMNYNVSTAPSNMTFINVVFKVRSTPNTVNP